MGGLLDAMKSAGLATDEQIKNAEREKAEEARLAEERKAARRAKDLERKFGNPELKIPASLPGFIRLAIQERREQIDLYITRTEERMGRFPPKIRSQLKRLTPTDALMMLGTTLTLFSVIRDVGGLKEGVDRDELVKRAYETAMTPLLNTLRETFPKEYEE